MEILFRYLTPFLIGFIGTIALCGGLFLFGVSIPFEIALKIAALATLIFFVMDRMKEVRSH